MGPGGDLSPQCFTPLQLLPKGDALSWREEVPCWARAAGACADGGDKKAKGMYAAPGMVLFCFLPRSKRQITKKCLEAKDFVLGLLGQSFATDAIELV